MSDLASLRDRIVGLRGFQVRSVRHGVDEVYRDDLSANPGWHHPPVPPIHAFWFGCFQIDDQITKCRISLPSLNDSVTILRVFMVLGLRWCVTEVQIYDLITNSEPQRFPALVKHDI